MSATLLTKLNGKEVMEQKFNLDKVEMKQTGFLQKGKYPENFAYAFSYDDEGTRQADPLFYMENYYAAGCMFSSAKD